MSITHGYITLDQLRRATKILGQDETERLEQAINAASRQIDGMCNRFFYATESEVRYYSADDPGDVGIDDLATITELATDSGSRTYGTVWTTDEYDLYPDNATLFGIPSTRIRPVSGVFPTTRRGIRITGVWGWPAVPDAIVQATLLQATRLAKRQDSPYGIAGSNDLGQVQLLPRLDPDLVQLVAPFRRFALGAV